MSTSKPANKIKLSAGRWGFIKGAAWGLFVVGAFGVAFYWAGGFHSLPQIEAYVRESLPRFENTPTPRKVPVVAAASSGTVAVSKTTPKTEQTPSDIEGLAEMPAVAAVPAAGTNTVAEELMALKGELTNLQLQLIERLNQPTTEAASNPTATAWQIGLAQLALAAQQGNAVEPTINMLRDVAPNRFAGAVASLSTAFGTPAVRLSDLYTTALQEAAPTQTEQQPASWWQRFVKIEKLDAQGRSHTDVQHSHQRRLLLLLATEQWDKARSIASAELATQIETYQAQQGALNLFWRQVAEGTQ